MGDEDDLLVPREKTKDEIEREEEEYRAFLEREVGQDLAEIITIDEGQGEASSAGVKEEEEKAESKKKKKGKKEKEKSGKTNQDDDQEFLMKCVSWIVSRSWGVPGSHSTCTCTVTSSIVAGSTSLLDVSRPIKKSLAKGKGRLSLTQRPMCQVLRLAQRGR